ncbi:MAG: radical SAM protein [Nitrospirota bacterium]
MATFTLPPMALAILASLTPKTIELKITDELVEDVDLSAEADVVALSVNTTNSQRAYQLAAHFRKKGAKIIMGGIHPSVMPEEALLHADSVVIGEAEYIWNEVISDFLNGRPKELYNCSCHPDMADVPEPSWEILKSKKYFMQRTFQVSRGCPYGCSFCSSTRFFGKKYRFKPIGQVADEIRHYLKKFVVFVDDNIVGKPDYSRELFLALKPLKKRWIAQSSIDIAKDENLLKLAAESGCAGLLIGFESVRYANKKDVRKLKAPDEYAEKIRLIHSYGISVHGSFVFGFDEDTEDVFHDTVDFVFKNRLEVANYCKLTPFPGTELFEQMKKEERLLTMDWSKYDRYHLVFRPMNIDIKRFYYLTDEAYKKTFSFFSILRRTPQVIKNIPYYFAINLSYGFGARLRRKRESGNL